MPIIALSLRGVLISSKPWKQAHLAWFKSMAQRLDDPSIMDAATSEQYSYQIDEIMARAYPNLSISERREKSQELFLDVICEGIESNPSCVERGLVDFFLSLKPKYEMVLITPSSKKEVKRILAAASLLHVFDNIYASIPNEGGQGAIFQRFLEENEKPSLYIGSNEEDTLVYCEEQGVPHIFIEEGENSNSLQLLSQLQEVLGFGN